MFKSTSSSISSYLFPQWFKKNTTTTTVDEDSKPIPKNFTISNQDNKLINVSMDKEIDEFIDIQTKPLSYAEVAQFGKYKKQSISKPSSSSSSTNSKFENLSNSLKKIDNDKEEESKTKKDLLDLNPDEIQYEPFKSGEEYDRNMNYKNKQSKAIIKKKKLHREYKNKSN